MCRRLAGVDQEIAVHFRDLRAADAKTPAAGGIDQFPGAFAGRILEGRAAGLFADRLRGLAMGLYFAHARTDRLGRADVPAKTCRGENDRGIDAAVAIDEFHAGIVERMPAAVAPDAGRLDQYILGLAAIGAGIPAQRSADPPRDAEIELDPADIGGSGGLGH